MKSENPWKLSSSTLQASIRLLKRVPMGSKGCPTQPSRFVIEVTPLWRRSVPEKMEGEGREIKLMLAPPNNYKSKTDYNALFTELKECPVTSA